MKSTTLLLSVATLSAGLIISGGTRAEDWKPVGQAGFLGIGKTYEIEKGHVYWVGDYVGTFLNDEGEKSLINHARFKCPAWGDIDFNNKKVKEGGVCIMTDLDGDRAYAAFQGTGMPSQTAGTWEWTAGTGKYNEIKGSNTYSGHLTANWLDGTASGYVTWNR